jgi:hypothetical protein
VSGVRGHHDRVRLRFRTYTSSSVDQIVYLSTQEQTSPCRQAVGLLQRCLCCRPQNSPETAETVWTPLGGAKPASPSSPATCSLSLPWPTTDGSYSYRVQLRPGRNYVTATFNGDSQIGETGCWGSGGGVVECGGGSTCVALRSDRETDVQSHMIWILVTLFITQSR